ncbi:restriction endonuclease [Trichococcus sp.]|uniref:restriction endonuclease n=1 Tax=Trichococcus sp. TaxID=1985464 RepID=UPI003C7B5CEE
MVEDDVASMVLLILVLCIFPILLFNINHYIKQQKYFELLKRANMAEIDMMIGVQFEHYLQQLFLMLGYQVKLTRASGDFGADLILIKDNAKIAVQAKRYTKNVGLKAVQEVFGAKKYYGANEAWVVTNSFYTKQARELAHSNEVSLIDRNDLLNLILNAKELDAPNSQQNKTVRFDIFSAIIRVLGYSLTMLAILILLFIFV